MYDISVIVPVYNTEKYLKKCLDSLVNQTMDNIEIIVVNDGSIDHSEEIIKSYIKDYPNKLKYYKKENGGLSSARNYGVKYATGNYITFVDSDDYLDKNLYESLKEYIQKDIDLIKFKAIKKYESGKEENFNGPVFEEKNGQEAFNELCFKDKLLEPAWLYLYKRDFWNINKFQYTENTYHEDFGLTPLVICSAKSVSSVDIYGYYYIQRENSLVTDKTNNLKKANDLLIHYDNLINKLNELNKIHSKQYIKEIKSRKIINNIKISNIKQFVKKVILKINIKLFLKMR